MTEEERKSSRERGRKYRAAHPERESARKRAFKTANPGVVGERRRAWCEAHPEKSREMARNTPYAIAKNLGMPGKQKEIPKELLDAKRLQLKLKRLLKRKTL